MCCMIAELVTTMNTVTGDSKLEITNQNILFPEPAAHIGIQSGVVARNIKETLTHVCRGPTEGSHLTSSS